MRDGYIGNFFATYLNVSHEKDSKGGLNETTSFSFAIPFEPFRSCTFFFFGYL